jgi:hypothetical protein
MLIELITPSMLAKAPMRIDIPNGSYDHESQVSTYTKTAQMFTVNGTRTFDTNGKPNDSDND